MPKVRLRASGRMSRKARERLVRQLCDFPHDTHRADWTEFQRSLVWHAYGYATGEFRFRWWPIHVMSYEFAPPPVRRELEREYVELSRTDQWAWNVVLELHRLGHLDELPARPRRGRGQPLKDASEAASLVLACGILEELRLAKVDAEEVLGHWLGYPDESASQSAHKKLVRGRKRTREYLRSVQPGPRRAP